MFKDVSIFKYSLDHDRCDYGGLVEAARFHTCGPTQDKSVGFVPPRGNEHDPLIESVAGCVVLEVAIETKSVPGEIVKREMAALLKKIEEVEGRRPGRKEQRELRDEVVQDLIRSAFPKQKRVKVMMDKIHGRLLIASAAASVIDEVVTLLIKVLEGMSVCMLNTKLSPQAAMTSWLIVDELDGSLGVGRDVELKSRDETGSVVKYNRHHIDPDEMRKHVSQGKLPTKLAMNWDGRVDFTLTEGLQLKRINFLDGVFDVQERDDVFEADVAITIGEMRGLIADLVDALQGEAE